jgi:hypothetical protein
VVDGTGPAATGGWKWVNLPQYSFGGAALMSFTVPAGSLTQTFQIGAREDGLDFDKFVFGPKGSYFTVANLDAGAPGSTTPPVVFVPTSAPLATGKAKCLGVAVGAAQALGFGAYWNAVTPENGGKWSSVESTRSTCNWADLDKAYAQAKPATGPQGISRLYRCPAARLAQGPVGCRPTGRHQRLVCGRVALSLPASLSNQPLNIALLNSLIQNVLHLTLAASASTTRALELPGVARGLYTVRLQASAGTFSQRFTVD